MCTEREASAKVRRLVTDHAASIVFSVQLMKLHHALSALILMKALNKHLQGGGIKSDKTLQLLKR